MGFVDSDVVLFVGIDAHFACDIQLPYSVIVNYRNHFRSSGSLGWAELKLDVDMAVQVVELAIVVPRDAGVVEPA